MSWVCCCYPCSAGVGGGSPGWLRVLPVSLMGIALRGPAEERRPGGSADLGGRVSLMDRMPGGWGRLRGGVSWGGWRYLCSAGGLRSRVWCWLW